MKTYLRNGAIAGIGGGAALGLFLLLMGEQSITDAIAIEEAHGGGGEAMFSRTIQLVGGGLGSLVIGAALGSIFGIVFAATRHRLPGMDDWQRSLWLAIAAFVTIQLVPALKYPANPPAVGDPDTVGQRTGMYLLLIAFVVVAGLATARLSIWLKSRDAEAPTNVIISAGLWIALVGTALIVFPPSPDAVLAPATLVWRFRITSLGGVLAFWMATGAAFGVLQTLPHRALRRNRSQSMSWSPDQR